MQLCIPKKMIFQIDMIFYFDIYIHLKNPLFRNVRLHSNKMIFQIDTNIVKQIDLSTSYIILSGVGTAMICTIVFIYLNSIINLIKSIALVAIISGCVVLKFAEK